MDQPSGPHSARDAIASGAARPDRSNRNGAWREAIACAWLIAFVLFFFSFTLPNNDVSRLQIWTELDLYLFPLSDGGPPSGWRFFPQRFDLLLVAAAILAGAWGWGRLALRAIGAPLAFCATAFGGGGQDARISNVDDSLRESGSHSQSECTTERTVFAFALGLSGLSLVTLACGLVSLLSRPLVGGIVLLGPVAEGILRMAYRGRGGEVPGPRAAVRSRRSAAARAVLPGLCLLVAAPFLLSMLLGSMLPSTDFDAKAYHLQGPKEFYQAGRVSFLPHNVYTSFPFLTEMLTLLAMVLRDDWYCGALAGQAVLMSFGPLTALALYAAGRRFFGPAAGWLAALVYLTTPWVYRISTIAYAEGGLSFYLFASVFAVMLGIERLGERGASAPRSEAVRGEDLTRGAHAPRSPGRLFLLAGLLAGSAMACKYTGVVSVIIPLGAVVAVASYRLSKNRQPDSQCGASPLTEGGRGGVEGGAASVHPPAPPCKGGETALAAWHRAVRWAGVFALGTAITVGPWLIKNAVETGNPVYPLLYSVFGGRDWDAELNARWRAAHSPPDHDVGRLPFWIVDVTARNDWLSPLLYGLAPLAFFAFARRRLVGWLWLYLAYLFVTWWLLTHRIDRFWVPMLPVAALLAGVGAASVTGRLWRYVCGIGVVAAALFNLGIIVSGAAGYNAFLIDLDYARKSYAEHWTPPRTAPGIAFLNYLRLPPGSKVLCIAEAQVFDADFRLAYNTVFDRSLFEEWFAAADPDEADGRRTLRSADEIRRKLRDEGITHIFVNWREAVRYRLTYGSTDFVAPARFAELRRLGLSGRPVLPAELPDYEALPERERRELEAWAPELRVDFHGKPAFIPFELYPVNR